MRLLYLYTYTHTHIVMCCLNFIVTHGFKKRRPWPASVYWTFESIKRYREEIDNSTKYTHSYARIYFDFIWIDNRKKYEEEAEHDKESTFLRFIHWHDILSWRKESAAQSSNFGSRRFYGKSNVLQAIKLDRQRCESANGWQQGIKSTVYSKSRVVR